MVFLGYERRTIITEILMLADFNSFVLTRETHDLIHVLVKQLTWSHKPATELTRPIEDI